PAPRNARATTRTIASNAPKPAACAPTIAGAWRRWPDATAVRGACAGPGPGGHNRPMSSSMTDVDGIEVGHFTDARRPTGCTVVLARAGAVAGVDVRGAAPGTRETDLLHPSN